MSNVYIWHSTGSAETAEWLAKQLKTKNVGKLPKPGFSGVALSFGARPTDKFKWNDRNFQTIMNDPRTVRPLVDRQALFQRLGEEGLSVISCVPLTEEATYSNVCNLLAAGESEGFIVCKRGGASARVVTTQADLQSAIDEGCNRALDRRFGSDVRIRLFVVDGQVVGALSKAPASNAQFAQRVAQDILPKNTSAAQRAASAQLIQNALAAKYISAAKSFWSPMTGEIPNNMRIRAAAAAAACGFDFCAVDIQQFNGNIDVLNVVTTPNLREVGPELQEAVVGAFNDWIKKNTRTAKQTLAAAIEQASEEEAQSVLDFLQQQGQSLVAGG